MIYKVTSNPNHSMILLFYQENYMPAMLFNNDDVLDCRSFGGYSFENVSSEVNGIQSSSPTPVY